MIINFAVELGFFLNLFALFVWPVFYMGVILSIAPSIAFTLKARQKQKVKKILLLSPLRAGKSDNYKESNKEKNQNTINKAENISLFGCTNIIFVHCKLYVIV